MKIYENLTFLSHNYQEALNFYKENNNKKINILYSFKSILWQGPALNVSLPILPKPLIAILYFITSILNLLNIELLYHFNQYTYLS